MPANPLTTPSEWDTFRVAGVALPGIAKVTGCVDASKLDVPKGSGTSGATINYQGRDTKTFKVELTLMTAEELDEWETGEGRRILMAPPEGKNAKAFAVDHPACQYVGIKSAVKQSVSAPEQSGDAWKVLIELEPADPPKPSSGTPKGSQTKAGPGGAPQPTAQTEADKAIAELEKQIDEETAKL